MFVDGYRGIVVRLRAIEGIECPLAQLLPMLGPQGIIPAGSFDQSGELVFVEVHG
jgi:hypothetical protein